MEDIPRLVEKGKIKPKTKEEQKRITAQEFVERLEQEILDTSSQMITIEGVLEQIEDQKLEQYFTPKMLEALTLSLKELSENVTPAVNKIKSTIEKWRM